MLDRHARYSSSVTVLRVPGPPDYGPSSQVVSPYNTYRCCTRCASATKPATNGPGVNARRNSYQVPACVFEYGSRSLSAARAA